MARVETLRNLGPYSARSLGKVGIHTAEDLREAGAPLAYRMLRHRAGGPAHLLFLYAMAGALDGRDVHSYSPEEKAALREAASGDLHVR